MRCKLILLLIAAMLTTAVATAQPTGLRKVAYLKDTLSTCKSDSQRVRLLYRIAVGYYEDRNAIPHWMDSAGKYTRLVVDASHKIGYKSYIKISRLLEPYINMVSGRHDKAIAAIDRMGDSIAVRAYHGWGSYYNGSGFAYSLNLDSAFYFFQKALVLSEQLNDSFLIFRSCQSLASFFGKKQDTAAIRKYANKAAAVYPQRPENMAILWYNTGVAVPLDDRVLKYRKYCFEQCLAVCKRYDSAVMKLDPFMYRRIYMAMGDMYDYGGNDSMAVDCFNKALDRQAPAKDKDLFQLYIRLHDKYYYNGNFDKAFYYAVEALKGAEAAGYRNLHQYYLYIGNNSFEMGQVARSVEYYERGLASARNSNDKVVSGVLIKRMARSLVALGRAKEALALVQAAPGIYRLPQAVDSMLLEEALGISYNGLGQYDLAEKHYLRMASYTARIPKLQAAICSIVWGKFYYQRGQYDKASVYLKECLDMPAAYMPRFAIGEAYQMLYRIDSSRQQYQSALQYHLRYRVINDSIFQSRQQEQLQTLSKQFDLERKDHELKLRAADIQYLTKEALLQQALAEQGRKDALLKQQDIDLLTQEAAMQDLLADKQSITLQQQQKEIQLHQENIRLLHGREQLQDAKLRQADFIKQLTIGGILLLLIIVVLLYSRYHMRQKNNREMGEKNARLHELLEEKEWLLKEVHHRVKNNLQVVLSLLQSQSAYLQDEALAAVHDSQHRVQAMSLIHQKLYQSDNVAAIDMGTYVPELVSYLQDCFSTSSQIRLDLEVWPVQLDVKQAIPLGLIINEAVTNAFKHAFPQGGTGQVSVTLQPFQEDELVLNITDNGIGLPDDYQHPRHGSLGMSLMKGLCGDFQAHYAIESTHGTHVRVIFPRYVERA